MGFFLKPSGENLTGSFCSGIRGTQDRRKRKWGVRKGNGDQAIVIKYFSCLLDLKGKP
jgi:hypothetical protein